MYVFHLYRYYLVLLYFFIFLCQGISWVNLMVELSLSRQCQPAYIPVIAPPGFLKYFGVIMKKERVVDKKCIYAIIIMMFFINYSMTSFFTIRWIISNAIIVYVEIQEYCCWCSSAWSIRIAFSLSCRLARVNFCLIFIQLYWHNFCTINRAKNCGSSFIFFG